MNAPPTADEYRQALEVVLEGIGIPHGLTSGDDAKRAEILQMRVIDVLIMVKAVLSERGDIAWTLDYCREQLARRPAQGYQPSGTPIRYGRMREKCADGGCGHPAGSHWEIAEPGSVSEVSGPRAGCAYLGCPCTAYADAALAAPEYDEAAALAAGEQAAAEIAAARDRERRSDSAVTA